MPALAFAASLPPAIPDAPAMKSSIPYPGGGIYMSRGIYTTLAGGQYHNFGDTNNLYQWQGEAGYYYTPWFSGGIGFRMQAGQPSDASQVIRNRFFVLGRFHKSWSRVAGYLGTEIGMDDINISLSPSDSNLSQPLSRINAGLGFQFGLGWKFSRYLGATFGQSFETSFVGEASDRPGGGSLNFHTLPGLAVDVLAFTPSLKKKVRALDVFVELQFGRLVLQNKSSQDFAWITGGSLVF